MATKNGTLKEFGKFVFHERGKENGPFIIQNLGNYEISQTHALGIAKNTARRSVRTKPSSLERLLTLKKRHLQFATF